MFHIFGIHEKLYIVHNLSNDHHGIDTNTNDSSLRIINFFFNYITFYLKINYIGSI